MNITSINNTPVYCKEIDGENYNFSDKKKTTLANFLLFADYLSIGELRSEHTCKKLNHLKVLLDGAENYDPRTPKTKQDCVWRALQRQISPFNEKSPENIKVDDAFLQTVFKPIIPDSFLLKASQNDKTGLFARVLRTAATVALCGEAILRGIVSQFLSFGISCYSLYDKDRAALSQLQLDLNRYQPWIVLKDKFLALVGGY